MMPIQLCHSDARCSKSVSIPAPVHYAHLAAYASRSFEFTEADTNEEYVILISRKYVISLHFQ